MSGAPRRRGGLPRRISVIGVPGAGKTALSRAIARSRRRAHINADRYIWGANWTLREPHPESEFRAALREKRAWIADGSVHFGPEEMLGLSDLVIYLDYSVPRLVLHNLRRWLVHRKSPRAELPAGCEERFPLQILAGVVLGIHRRVHEEALRAHPPRRLVRLRSPRKLRTFLDQTAGEVRPGSS